MFRKISMEAVGLSLLILALSLVTATLALAETNHRAFENAGQYVDEPTAPERLRLSCLESSDGASILASLNLEVTPYGQPVRALVSSKTFGVCESQSLPSQSMTGAFDTHTFDVGGPHCDSTLGPVVISVYRIQNYIGSSARGAALTLGSKNYTCVVRP